VGGGRASWQLAPRRATEPGIGGGLCDWHRIDRKEQMPTELTEVVRLRLLRCLLLNAHFSQPFTADVVM